MAANEWQESSLIAAAQQGDMDSFNELVLHYQTQVYNLAYHLLGDPAAADDATQEAFISAYRALPRFRGGSFRAWLMRIVKNACYDEMRRWKRRPIVSWDDFGELDEEANPHLADDAPRPEARYQQAELRRWLEQVLQSLPKEQRLVIVLVDRLGYSYEEAAQVMNVRIGTVRSRLSRARRKVQKLLQAKQELLPSRYRLNGTETGEA